MNPTPISDVLDADLRGSWAAIQRAAVRARELAAQTGTALVIVEDGQIKHLRAEQLNFVQFEEPHKAQ
jgi:hypothetical protein